MGTESTGWERDGGAPAPPSTAVPIRRVIGASPQQGRWASITVKAMAGAGWVLAGALVFGGGFMLWHLLFGDSYGGDVWLGQPPDLTETTTDDTLPGGEPWFPGITPDATTAPTVTVLATAAPTTTAATTTSTLAPVTVAAQPPAPPVNQAPAAQSGSGAQTPVTGTLPSAGSGTGSGGSGSGGSGSGGGGSGGGSPVTVTTVTATTATTTTPSTTIADATTTTVDDASSTTIDDGPSGGGGGNSGSGNSGSGGSGGGSGGGDD